MDKSSSTNPTIIQYLIGLNVSDELSSKLSIGLAKLKNGTREVIKRLDIRDIKFEIPIEDWRNYSLLIDVQLDGRVITKLCELPYLKNPKEGLNVAKCNIAVCGPAYFISCNLSKDL
jgi:hypothetical protein